MSSLLTEEHVPSTANKILVVVYEVTMKKSLRIYTALNDNDSQVWIAKPNLCLEFWIHIFFCPLVTVALPA